MNLSKSKYLAGMQCPKMLWMDKNMPEQKAEQDESVFIIGNMVGDLAMGYFGDYTEIPFDRSNFAGMAEQTRRLIAAGTSNIAEATFSIGGSLCMVDILHKGAKGYEIVEVKSSAGSPGDTAAKVEPVYLHDMAYQYYVVKESGLEISKVSILRLNREYIRRGKLDINKLFVLTDCTDAVLEMQGDIPDNIKRIKSAATQKDEPAYTIGSRCDNPYTCLYKGWCFRNLPENNVFDIGFGIRKSKLDKAYQSGVVGFDQVLSNPSILNAKQLRQVNMAVNKLPPYIEVGNIRQFLDKLTYPLYHLDFETVSHPVPLWDGTKPYQQIPFQYSLHIQDEPGSEPVHKEFLAEEGIDPRRELAERLCEDIPKGSCMLVYNAAFEKRCIRLLAELFPDLSKHLMNIHKNIKDLMEPFIKGYYYSREMGGSYSIKVVLPALCGDDPELSYKGLEIIKDGTGASGAYATLHEQPPEQRERIRKALLTYCKLDTLAMVKVLEELYRTVGGVV